MNNGYNDVNNYQNSSSNMNNQGNDKKSLVLNLGLLALFAIGIVFVSLTLNMNDGQNQVEENVPKEEVTGENNVDENTNNSSSGPTSNQNNNNNVLDTDSDENNSTDNNEQKEETPKEEPSQNQTVTDLTLTCAKTTNTQYGKFDYKVVYTLKYDKMIKGVSTIKVTLNDSYKSYRDSLISELKNENAKFVKLDGISEKVDKHGNGFTYTFTIDAEKLSTKELADLGYRTINQSGIRMNAYNSGYTCK